MIMLHRVLSIGTIALAIAFIVKWAAIWLGLSDKAAAGVAILPVVVGGLVIMFWPDPAERRAEDIIAADAIRRATGRSQDSE